MLMWRVFGGWMDPTTQIVIVEVSMKIWVTAPDRGVVTRVGKVVRRCRSCNPFVGLHQGRDGSEVIRDLELEPGRLAGPGGSGGAIGSSGVSYPIRPFSVWNAADRAMGSRSPSWRVSSLSTSSYASTVHRGCS